MPTAVKKKPPKEREAISELLEKMTPENRAAFERIMELRKGNEGVVDTVALIREVRGG